jgi:hypothetical protein
VNNIKIKNNNYIKNYFAFVLMVFAVFGGSNINNVLESTEGGYSVSLYTVRAAKFIQYNEFIFKLASKQKLSLINNKTKSNNIDSVKNISLNSALTSIATIITVIVISVIPLFIYYCNNGLIKNSIWLRAVY